MANAELKQSSRSLLTQRKMHGQTLLPARVWKAPCSSRFLFIFFIQILFFSFLSVFTSSSPSQNKKDNCKKMMLVNRRHFENNDFMSWSCFCLESQLHVSPYVQKYTNVSKILRNTQFVRTQLRKIWRKALRRKLHKCECGLSNPRLTACKVSIFSCNF